MDDGRCAVKPVAKDGVVKTLGVCTMYTQLVGASCVWGKDQMCVSVDILLYIIMCMCPASVYGIGNLMWQVVEIGSQGQGYFALGANLHLVLQKCLVLLVNGAVFELALQIGKRSRIAGKEHNPAGILVEAVCWQTACDALYGGIELAPGNGQEA